MILVGIVNASQDKIGCHLNAFKRLPPPPD